MKAERNRPSSWVIPFLIAACLAGVPAQAKYSGGTGTADAPYQIATTADLIALGETPEDYGSHSILTADIDLDPSLPGRKVFDRAVIASEPSWFGGIPFTGAFDGAGHTISHLTVTGQYNVGLFGNTGPGASVSNLGLEAVKVSGESCVGGLVGYNEGSIVACYSDGSVSSSTGGAGGLVGSNIGGIVASYSSGSVKGDGPAVGGLVGYGEEGSSIIASHSGSFVNGATYVGGLAGDNSGSIVASYSNGCVVGTDKHIGGLVGTNGGVGNIVMSCSTTFVDGPGEYVGGLVGSSWGHTISSFWDIATSNQATSAGGTGLFPDMMMSTKTYLDAHWDFVGEVYNGTCDYWQMERGEYPQLCWHHGNRPQMPEGSGTAEQPYLIRDARDLGVVWFEPLAHYRLAQSVDLWGITWSTGVVPWFGGAFDGNGRTISYLMMNGGDYLGLFGQLGSAACVSRLGMDAAEICCAGYTGALAGYNRGSITASCSSGTVSGVWAVGGLVGCNCGSIAASYNQALVHAGSYVGGLAGYNKGGAINASHNVGPVNGRSDVGGLVGYSFEGSVSSSFWDTQTSGQPTSADGGTGKTTAEMQVASTFKAAGWDFIGETNDGTEDLWWIDEGRDYPRLSWEATVEE